MDVMGIGRLFSTNQPNSENAIFFRRSFVNDVNSQPTNWKEIVICLCAILINCLIYKLHCEMKRAWLSTNEFCSIKNQFQSYYIRQYTRQWQSWYWNGFWWFSFAIVSDAPMFVCFVMDLLKCFCVWEEIYSLVAFAGNQLSFKLTRFCENASSCVWWVLSGWHAKTWLPYKQYQSFPFGCHFDSATTTTTTSEMNSQHAIWLNWKSELCVLTASSTFMQKSLTCSDWVYDGNWWKTSITFTARPQPNAPPCIRLPKLPS